MTKPFGPRELVARLEAVLRRAGPEADEPVIAADGLEIDLAGRIVRHGGEPVHLTPTEFELLAALARNRGRLMTHSACWARSGDRPTPTTSRFSAPTSPTCVARSSRGESTRYIRTDPGVGYRFARLGNLHEICMRRRCFLTRP